MGAGVTESQFAAKLWSVKTDFVKEYILHVESIITRLRSFLNMSKDPWNNQIRRTYQSSRGCRPSCNRKDGYSAVAGVTKPAFNQFHHGGDGTYPSCLEFSSTITSWRDKRCTKWFVKSVFLPGNIVVNVVLLISRCPQHHLGRWSAPRRHPSCTKGI